MAAETMTVAELAEQLGLSRSTVYRRLAAGEIPHVKVGERYILYRPRTEQWLGEPPSRDIDDLEDLVRVEVARQLAPIVAVFDQAARQLRTYRADG